MPLYPLCFALLSNPALLAIFSHAKITAVVTHAKARLRPSSYRQMSACVIEARVFISLGGMLELLVKEAWLERP